MLTDQGGIALPVFSLTHFARSPHRKEECATCAMSDWLAHPLGSSQGGRDGTAWVAGWVEWWVVMVSGGWWVVACGVIASRRACLGALRVIGPRVMRCG
jgi:hypothetical protein